MGMPSGFELFAIVAVVVLLFGGKKIPEMMKGLGKGIKDFKGAIKEDEPTTMATNDKKIEDEKVEETKSSTTDTTTKDITLGHFATPVAFSLAKELRKNPMMIAEDLAGKFENSTIFESVVAIKGFVNFKLSNDFLTSQIDTALSLQEEFAKGETKNEKILLEFVSANPTGPLHIGHARGAVFGDALFKVGKYLGYDVTSEYYVNDAGAQMQLLATSLNLAAKENILKEEVEYPEQFYRGDYLIDIAQKCVELYGKDVFNDPSKEEELALFAKDEVLKIIKKDMADLGVSFDNYVSEKSLY
ncbi:Arginine--tRNA ligase, partial [Aduncisulcus paluster]